MPAVQETPQQSKLHNFFSSNHLRKLAWGFVGAGLLAGCSQEAPPLKISAESFRTNFQSYAGSTVAFEAYYTKDAVARTGHTSTTNQPTVFRYDFFSDTEKSLKVATFTSRQDIVRDKALVTIPISANASDTVNVEWNKLSFSGIDDTSRAVNPGTVDRFLERTQDGGPAELHHIGTIR